MGRGGGRESEIRRLKEVTVMSMSEANRRER